MRPSVVGDTLEEGVAQGRVTELLGAATHRIARRLRDRPRIVVPPVRPRPTKKRAVV